MGKLCSIDECGSTAKKRGWCEKHYLRWRRNGTTDTVRKFGREPCSVGGCSFDSQAKGFCALHYHRWRRTGDPTKTTHAIRGEPQRYYRDVVLTYDCDECLIWPYGPLGDHYSGLWDGKRPVQVHRLVCRHFHGDPPSESHHAAHSCGNKKCCNWRHIRWTSPSENNADKALHGTRQNGERNGNSKLSSEQVKQIRALSGQQSQREIAEMFNVSQNTIWTIVNGHTWSHCD